MLLMDQFVISSVSLEVEANLSQLRKSAKTKREKCTQRKEELERISEKAQQNDNHDNAGNQEGLFVDKRAYGLQLVEEI